LFDKPCLRRILFHKKSGLRRTSFINERNEERKSSSQSFCGAFEFKFLVLSTNSLVVQMIQTPILSDYNYTTGTKQ